MLALITQGLTTNTKPLTTLLRVSASATTAPATVRVPMLGANGTGVRWDNATKSVNEPKVSDPLTDGTDDSKYHVLNDFSS